MFQLTAKEIRVEIQDSRTGTVKLSSSHWDKFRLEGLRPSLCLDGQELEPSACVIRQGDQNAPIILEYDFADVAKLSLKFIPGLDFLQVHSSLRNTSGRDIILNEVTLLGGHADGGSLSLGAARFVKILEQTSYTGRIRSLIWAKKEEKPVSAGEANVTSETCPGQIHSDLLSVAYDRKARFAFLAGFLTSERWLGRIGIVTENDGRIASWRIWFDGGDTRITPDQITELEEFVLTIGRDPLSLMDWYGEMVKKRHGPQFPEEPPVSFCSWYPFRLSVTEERILANAYIAAERLKPLGLKIIEVDLGWEEGNLPSTYTENERFPHGLRWLAEELGKLGFSLGVWKAPFSISEFDPVSVEHPEWLIHGPDGKPVSYYEWFWEPYGKTFILDLTHPGARQWLREKIRTLAERGVKYFKADFINAVSHPLAKRRYDAGMVCGGGTEAGRLGAQIIREALPDALILNCGGPDMPGKGQWPLLYACQDTGNTGFVSHRFQYENYLGLACHLFKNKRWGIIQPSCLCVGLPGTVDDARIRATVAFLTGGQIDISDDLTTLPEERWPILTASLPVLNNTARPVNLFEPVCESYDDYEAMQRGEADECKEQPPGTVWHAHVVADWDEWDLVGVFSFDEGASAEEPKISRFCIPFYMLGIPEHEARWGYEFWSQQFLGILPGRRLNPGGYSHAGDFQELKVGGRQGFLEIAFFGPGVKLLCLRKPRDHPWVVGTSFHQSCGQELEDVRWDPDSLTLSGIIRRPPGESGVIVIATNGMRPVYQQVNGQFVPIRRSANHSLVLPIIISGDITPWSVRFTSDPHTGFTKYSVAESYNT